MQPSHGLQRTNPHHTMTKPMKKRALQVFDEMALSDNKKLRFAPLSNISSVDIKGDNGFVTLGVPIELAYDLMHSEDYVGGLLVVDRSEFEDLRNCLTPTALMDEVIASAEIAMPDRIEEIVKEATNRFLGWKLPEDFAPDCGIEFQKEYNVSYNANQGLPPCKHEPVGTNLFDAQQAKAMVRYILEDTLTTLTKDIRKEVGEDLAQKVVEGRFNQDPVSAISEYARELIGE